MYLEPRRKTHDQYAAVVDLDRVELDGALIVPAHASAVAILPYLGRPGRRGHRHQRLADDLRARGLATFALDLRTTAEVRRHALDETRPADLAALAERLIDATDWLRSRPPVWDLPIGYVAGDAAAAALVAAAARPAVVCAVVTWGGRPDLAGAALPRVEAATLLLAPSRNRRALEHDRHAIAALFAPAWVESVPAASLDGDDARVDDVAERASHWLLHHATGEPARWAS